MKNRVWWNTKLRRLLVSADMRVIFASSLGCVLAMQISGIVIHHHRPLHSIVSNVIASVFGTLLGTSSILVAGRLKRWIADKDHNIIVKDLLKLSGLNFLSFILLLLPRRNREHIIGDLEEEYRTVALPKYGGRLVRCWYVWQMVGVIAPYAWAGIKRAVGIERILKMIGR